MKNILKRNVIRVLVFIAIAACVFIFRYRNFDSVLNVDYSKVDKILTSSGSSSKIIELTDKDEIEDYINMFNDTKVRRDINQLKYAGFCLEVRFFEGDNQVGSIDYGLDDVQP